MERVSSFQKLHSIPKDPHHTLNVDDWADEGYNSTSPSPDEKSKSFDNDKRKWDREIPIMRSAESIRMSYTPITYLLTILAIVFHFTSLYSRSTNYTFPAVYEIYCIVFHTTHVFAHSLVHLRFERICVIYGSWLVWVGWVLGVMSFSERLPLDLAHPTIGFFGLLILERRNAWGIIMWEFVSRLDEFDSVPGRRARTKSWLLPRTLLSFSETGGFRVASYRIWCLLGCGSVWSLIYVPLAWSDGFSLFYLLHPWKILRVFILNVLAGVAMICFWSFWTFQYRGVVWRRELRKGVAVWYSEGLVRAGDVV
ncbi:hypothetical protein K450DRAFT_241507 [Umbelopsis ramanniana AG]|uniref:Uncharacterized protein n=1 Tax=Umbelopsis ramanniana AG TaxID=1314678 RepID=A0AAD5EAU7_UMBRA|nr:uncharacterized protein K450DRAFT_241507 [Umbelopsis ramanniana AG]KAI8579551.1 hypothetical protein K450DRAFT_241507 [Umbelopsis ramanniana AG]